MNKKLTGIAIALLATAGVGYGLYAHNTANAATAEVAKTDAKVAAPADAAADPVVAKVDGREIHRT